MSWREFWKKLMNRKTGLGPGFSGWPATKRIDDPEGAGLPGVEIQDCCLAPGAARTAEVMAALLSLAVGADMVILSVDVAKLGFFIPAMIGVAGFFFVAKRFFGWLFSRLLWIRIFSDRIEIAGWHRFQCYETNIGYAFRLDDHEMAIAEELRWRQNPQNGRYYSDSQRLYFDHGRQPVFLADVYPKEKAKAVLGRLNAIQHGFSIESIK